MKKIFALVTVLSCGLAFSQNLYTFYDDLAVVILDGKYGFIDRTGTLVIKPQFEHALPFNQGLARVKLQGKFGFIDKTGRVVIACRFDRVGRFHDGTVSVGQTREHPYLSTRITVWGYVDTAGRHIAELEYDSAADFSEGLAVVGFGNGYSVGYINTTGKLVFSNKDTTYRYLDGFHEGLARASDGARWGFIDKNFSLVIPISFDYADSFSDNMAGIKSGGKWGYVNTRGELVVKPQFDKAGPYQDGVVAVQAGTNWRLINRQGEFLNANSYDSAAYDPVAKLFVVTRAKQWALIDRMGGVVLSFNNIDKISPPRDGLTLVVQDGTYAFVDAQGKFLILPAYNNAQSFSESRAAVRAGTKWGFIDQHGRVIIVYEYDEVLPFHEGLAGVRNGGFWGIIDRNGKLIAGLKYESAPQN